MYIDGLVLPLNDHKQAEYTAMAEKFAHKARTLGALAVVEGLGNALEHGHTTDFFRAVRAEDGENAVFSFTLWPDKATRDAGWARLMADPDLQPGPEGMPFDGKCMFWGGFTPIVSAIDLG